MSLQVSSLTMSVLACRNLQEKCRQERIKVRQKLPITSYMSAYHKSISDWVHFETNLGNKTVEVSKVNPSCIKCGSVAASEFDPIIHGNIAPDKYYPWQVLVRALSSFCGGVLVSSNWILTAAHCTNNTQYIVLGTTDLDNTQNAVFRRAEIVFVHESYSASQNDIALIKMDEKVDFSDYIRPACLPKDNAANYLSAECHVTGWGVTNYTQGTISKLLKETKVTVMSQWECTKRMRQANVNITPGHLCTDVTEPETNTGVCFGDSGGPLSCKIDEIYYVAGIVSQTQKNCEKHYIPDLFTRVSYYKTWIQDTIERYS